MNRRMRAGSGVGHVVVLAASLFSPLAASASPETKIAVLPLFGDASADAKDATVKLLIEALRSVSTLHVVSLIDLEGVFGRATKAAIEACKNDGCIAQAIASLAVDRIVVGSLDPSDQGQVRFDVRLVDVRQTGNPTVVRIVRDLSIARAVLDVLRRELDAIVADLFPEASKTGWGSVVFDIEPNDASLWIDDAPIPIPRHQALRLPAGPHRFRVSKEGHRTHESTIDVPLGAPVTVSISLEKRRSSLPLYLAGASLACAGGGIVFGVLAQNAQSAWADACGSGPCAAGFSRLRYEDDASSLARDRTATNVLFGVGAALAVSAVVYYFVDPGLDEDVP